jgi:glutaredoxin-like protein NrdH
MNRCDVQIFSLSTCIHCKDTKDFLNLCGIAYNCIDVDKLDPDQRKNVLEEIKQINPECSFPTLVIGDKVIVGFKKDEIKEIFGIK